MAPPVTRWRTRSRAGPAPGLEPAPWPPELPVAALCSCAWLHIGGRGRSRYASHVSHLEVDPQAARRPDTRGGLAATESTAGHSSWSSWGSTRLVSLIRWRSVQREPAFLLGRSRARWPSRMTGRGLGHGHAARRVIGQRVAGPTSPLCGGTCQPAAACLTAWCSARERHSCAAPVGGRCSQRVVARMVPDRIFMNESTRKSSSWS